MTPFSSPMFVKKPASDTVTIANHSSLAFGIDPEDAYASYRLGADGKIYQGGEAILTYDFLSDWISPLANAGNYQCKADLTSGAFTSGSDGVWENLTTNRSWYVQQPATGTNTAVFTLTIRNAITLLEVDTATITLTAEVSA